MSNMSEQTISGQEQVDRTSARQGFVTMLRHNHLCQGELRAAGCITGSPVSRVVAM